MSILPENLDYTTKDRDSIERRLRSLIDSVFPTWSEKTRANFGNILLGLMAHVGDIHTYYIDQWARESRISAAQLRRSLLGLVKLIDYKPRSKSAATADVTLTLASAMADTLVIPAGTICRTKGIAEPVEFQILEDVTFPAGALTASAVVENSETHTEPLISDGLPNQLFRLKHTPVVEQAGISPSVAFANGDYEQVDNLLDSSAPDRHFVAQLDSNDRLTLIFGNGVNGAIPQGSGTVTYKTGGGVQGNVEAGSIAIVDGNFADNSGVRAFISITNPTASAGGAERESNAEIRQMAPRAGRVLKRAIAREDYEIVAEQVSGVARALHVTKNEEPAVGENQGYLFIVPEGGGVASSTLLDEVRSRFFEVSGYSMPSHPTINTYDLRVQTAPYHNIDHVIRAYRAEGVSLTRMKAAIVAVLTDFYSEKIKASRLLAIAPRIARLSAITEADGDALVRNPLVNFGYYYKDSDGTPTNLLAWSDVFNIVRDLDELRKLDAKDGLLLNSRRADVLIGSFKFPRLGSVVVIDGDTGNTL